ncbi:NAD-dependent epimerase/dehydratase family protein [Candidatus Pacearchaeota archaeon]|nr:NAD-dependent epimerase/dehydratase family protein [Candidatus Pacearchaeota archaeon]
MVKNVLITGGLGFIGSNLAHKCVNLGYNVTLISKTKSKKENIKGIENKVNLIIKDVKDINQEVIGMDLIFHCASTGDNYNIHNEPYKDIEVNCNGTIALLEACRYNNKKVRIIYPSTFFVNGNLKTLPATSDSHLNPLGLYPATRLVGEYFCKIYNNVFEMNSVIVRFTNVFGIREQKDNNKKAAFNRMINTAINGGEIQLYDNGIIKRDYIYISDVIDACLIIAEKGKKGETYYIGRGEGVKFKKLVDIIIEEAMNGTINLINSPSFHKASGINDYYCDNTQLKKLGWKPKISLREGIRKTIKWSNKNDN